jgi:N-glycosidase YbiA
LIHLIGLHQGIFLLSIYFYDPRDPATGFLSNFYRAPFQLDGFEWQTVEHYYQAQKFEDAACCERIRLAATPREAKNLGQSSDMPVRADWESRRLTAMLQALVAKFTQNAELQNWLLTIGDDCKNIGTCRDTNDIIFVEASPQDHFWGEGADGKGENRLGYLLTTMRSQLQRFLASSKKGSFEYNNSIKNPEELANLLFDSVRRMHVTWWLTECLVLETQTAVLPENLHAYVRDVDLPEGYLEKYRVGLIFREPTFCDASVHSQQGLAAKHRYLLLSGNAKHLDALFGGLSGTPGTGLSIFQADTLWKVLAASKVEGHAQITLLEIPPLARHAFESQTLTVLEQGLADKALERFEQALRLPVLDACKGDEWLERLNHPLGIRDDGTFLESWFSGKHELAKAKFTAESMSTVVDSENVESVPVIAETPQNLGLKRALGIFIMLLGAYIGFVVAQTDSRPISVIVFAGVIVLFGALVAWRPDSVK